MSLLESIGLNDKFWYRLFEWLNVRFSLKADSHVQQFSARIRPFILIKLMFILSLH